MTENPSLSHYMIINTAYNISFMDYTSVLCTIKHCLDSVSYVQLHWLSS